jgi:hypothetical protein
MGRILLVFISLFLYQVTLAQNKTKVTFKNGTGGALYQLMEDKVSSMLTEFNLAFKEARPPEFGNSVVSEGIKPRIDALWNTSMFFSNETELVENILSMPGGGFQVRNIPVYLKGENGEQIRQEAVINFNASGIIDDLYFGLEQQQHKALLEKGTSLQDFRRRQIILDFVENFRTAYNRKDLDLLEKTFSDNALIIVGKTMKEVPDSPEMMLSLGYNRVQLIKYSKKEYLTNLVQVFQKNSFIDVRFDEISIVKHPAFDHIYGVNLQQSWKSSSYSDEGYIFLMIDFENENQPIIHVRSWQPYKDTDRREVIELGDFEIIK